MRRAHRAPPRRSARSQCSGSIAGKHLADSLGIGVGLFRQQRMRRCQNAGGAEAALQSMMLAERRLERTQLVALRQALDRRNLKAVRLHRKNEARAHRRTISDYCARAAHAMFAANMRAGELEIMAQAISERGTRLDRGFTRLAVDLEPHFFRLAHMFCCAFSFSASPAAEASARSVSTPKSARR